MRDDQTNTFEFIAGSLALDFVDTFGDRGSQGRERLIKDSYLQDWLQLAGLTSDIHKVDLPLAISLREAIYRTSLASIEGQAPNLEDLKLINEIAALTPLRPSLRTDFTRVLKADSPFEAALSVIAEDAIVLLSGDMNSRVRVCPSCQMFFVDRSRPGKRLWCSSAAGCGNKAKMKARRERDRLKATSTS